MSRYLNKNNNDNNLFDMCRSNLLTKYYKLKWWEQSILIKEVNVYLINYFNNANINFHFLFIKLIKSFFSLYQ